MKKLYRTTLIAGVLAFGVAACGDDVQIVDPEPTPPPALSVTLTPQQLTLTEGESANFTVGIVGGDPAAQAQVSCESSNTGVATVSASGVQCAVTAVSAGTATVTATVTRGNQTSSAGAAVTVQAAAPDGEPATVSIAQVLKGGSQVDLDNAFGQLDVVINLQRNDETVSAVRLMVNDTEVARQTFSRAELDEMAAAIAEDAELAEAVEQITLSFRSNFYEIVDGEAVIRTMNGDKGMSAEAIVMEDGEEQSRASDELPITFRNLDGFHVQAAFPEAGNSAVDAAGRRWYGNWGGEASELTTIPVFFSGQSAQNVAVNLCGQTRDEETGPFAFEFTCANFETARATDGSVGEGEIPVISAQYAGSGNDVRLQGRETLILNVESGDHPFPARIDNRAPQAETGAFVITRASGLNNTGNWVNAQYPFAAGFTSSLVTDAGVGRPATVADGVGFAISTGTTTATAFFVTEDYAATMGAAELDETVTNRELYAWAVVEDLLGNTGFIRQGADVDEDHPLGTFGYDNTAPTFSFFEDDDALGAIEGPYNFINQFSTEDGIGLRARDLLSGFSQQYGAEHALITIRGAFDGEGAISTAGIVTAATPGISATPFAAARAGDRIANLAPIAADLVDYVTQTEVEVDFTLAGALGDGVLESPARYYLYQVQLRDQAGNVARGYRAVYLNNNSQPNIENLTNPSVFDGNTTFRAALVQDSVEVFEGSLEIRYPNTGGTLVWERPGSALTSVLRMNAQIADGELFNDVIYRPQRGVDFPTGFAALGLDFVKNVQTLDPASLETARPDSVRARVFNGYGAEADLDPELNHSSAIPAFGGVSPMVSRSIQSEELSGPSFYFQTRSTTAPTATTTVDWSFGIVDTSADNCDTDFCVRAIGPRSDFTNPFNGGPMLIVWADDAGTGVNGEVQWRVMTVAEANFDNPFPTRDSGDNRIYEWTFNVPGDVNPGVLQGQLAIAAIGIRPSGDALLTALAIDPVFNVRFVDAPYTVERGSSVTMDIVHGMNSTGGAFDVQCQFLNAQGEPVNFPPAGLGISPAGQACQVTTTGDAEFGEYGVRATATQGDAQSVIETTVTVIAPPFAISMADADGAVPLSGTDTFRLPVTLESGGPIAQWVCSVEGDGLSADTYEDSGEVGCEVTATSGAAAGEYTVTVIAQETGTEAEATAEATLDLEAAIEVTVTPLEHIIARGDTETFAVTATFPNGGAIDSVVCDADGDLPAGLTATADGDNCDVEAAPDFDRDGASAEFTITVNAGDQVVLVPVTVTVEEVGPFAPVVEAAGTDADPRLVPQGSTVTFRIMGDRGFGVDDAAFDPAEHLDINPDDEDIDVIVERDSQDRPVIRVTADEDNELGRKTITVTLTEVATGETVDVVLEIQVTDATTGQGVIDG